MSDDILIFIPEDPTYQPDPVRAEQAKAFLTRCVPQAAEVRIEVTEEIEFVAPGENLVRILCPFCHTVLDKQWWRVAMNAAYERTHFADLTVTLPCCGRIGSLHTLIYEWPAGFARFQLLARDPGGDIEDEAFQDLEKILACPLRKIWAHI